MAFSKCKDPSEQPLDDELSSSVDETTEIARYIAAMVAELAAMARTVHLDVLAYFLEMARIEALSVEASQQRQGKTSEQSAST